VGGKRRAYVRAIRFLWGVEIVPLERFLDEKGGDSISSLK